MESERERTRPRHGSRLWAALVLVHDGANPNREWNHRRLPSAPVDLVVWTHWGAEPFSWNACGVAAPPGVAAPMPLARAGGGGALRAWVVLPGVGGRCSRGVDWVSLFLQPLEEASTS